MSAAVSINRICHNSYIFFSKYVTKTGHFGLNHRASKLGELDRLSYLSRAIYKKRNIMLPVHYVM